eukprot:12722406-Alexandrium_andersonii.AAC.1
MLTPKWWVIFLGVLHKSTAATRSCKEAGSLRNMRSICGARKTREMYGPLTRLNSVPRRRNECRRSPPRSKTGTK